MGFQRTVKCVKPTVNRRLAAALLINSAAGFIAHFTVAALLSPDGYSTYAAALAVASLPGVLHLAIHNQTQHAELAGAGSIQRQTSWLIGAAAGLIMLTAPWWATKLDLPGALTAFAVISYLAVAAFSSSVRGKAMAQFENLAATAMFATAGLRVVAATTFTLIHPVLGLLGLAVGELIPAVVLRARMPRVRAEGASSAEHTEGLHGGDPSRGHGLGVSVVAHVGMFLMCYAPVLVARGVLDTEAAASFAFSAAVVGGLLSLTYAIAWPAANAGSSAKTSALVAMKLTAVLSVPAVIGIMVASRVLSLEATDLLAVSLLCVTATLAAPVIVLMQVSLRAGQGRVITAGLVASSTVVVLGVSVQTTPVGLAASSVLGAAIVHLFAWRDGKGADKTFAVAHVVTQRFDRHEAVCKTVMVIAGVLPGEQCVIAPGIESTAGCVIAPRTWAPLSPLSMAVRRALRSAEVVVIHGGPLASLTALLAPRGRVVVHVYAAVRLGGIATWKDAHGTQASPLRALASVVFGWPALRLLLATGRVSHVVCASEEIRSHLHNAENSSVVTVSPLVAPLVAATYRAEPHLFFAGRAERTRGVFDVIAAVELLRSRGVMACATLAVRSGQHLDEVLRRAEELDSVLVLAGDSDRLSHEMAACTVGVWPFHAEATVTPATTTVEAAMAGLPIVATEIGCCSVVAARVVAGSAASMIADAVEELHSSEAVWTAAAARSWALAGALEVSLHADLLDETYRGGTTNAEARAVAWDESRTKSVDVPAVFGQEPS
jgi:glycosyltransferase involved in cell wall biosynthesis